MTSTTLDLNKINVINYCKYIYYMRLLQLPKQKSCACQTSKGLNFIKGVNAKELYIIALEHRFT